MAKTALQIIQAAMGELGMTQPTIAKGNQDLTIIQMLSLLNSLGRELQRVFDWQALCVEYRFNTQFLSVTGNTTANSAVITGLTATTGLDSTYMVLGSGLSQDSYVLTNDGASQVTLNQVASGSGIGSALSFCKTKYAFPTDYDRPIDQTQWDKTRHWEMQGPQTPQQWQWLKGGYISTSPRVKWRALGGYFQTWPPMASTEYLGFEYVSKNWALSAASVTAAELANDTDTCVFPDDLMIVGLKHRFTRAKGLATVYEDEYEHQLAIAKANDSGSDRISLGSQQSSWLIGVNNLPDTGYGGR